MSDKSAEKSHAREHTRIELGAAYGLIAGAALGSLVLALTGDVLWLSISPAFGLILGLAVASLSSPWKTLQNRRQ